MISIPTDILPTIFSFIDSTSQLANCRLVCRVWDQFAEEAMLGRRINIWRTETAWAFYNHLVQIPSKGRFVKHLDIGKLDISTHELHRRLLRLIFTPNLEVLQGQNCQSDYYDEMTRIAKKFPIKFRKLKVIPHPLSFSSSYRDTAILFKDTLQDVLVDDWDMLRHEEYDLMYLMQFKHLTSFACYFSSIEILGIVDALLGVLPQVKEIKLYITVEADDWAMDLGMDYLKQIPKNRALKALKVTTSSAIVIRLLMSKFVSLDSLELDLEIESDDLDIPYAVMLTTNPVPSLNYSFMVLKDKFVLEEEIEGVFGGSGRIEYDNGVYIVNVKR
ncbi:hypothetical protein MBANPS3_006331 [Mucor bainieri]